MGIIVVVKIILDGDVYEIFLDFFRSYNVYNLQIGRGKYKGCFDNSSNDTCNCKFNKK